MLVRHPTHQGIKAIRRSHPGAAQEYYSLPQEAAYLPYHYKPEPKHHNSLKQQRDHSASHKHYNDLMRIYYYTYQKNTSLE